MRLSGGGGGGSKQHEISHKLSARVFCGDVLELRVGHTVLLYYPAIIPLESSGMSGWVHVLLSNFLYHKALVLISLTLKGQTGVAQDSLNLQILCC